MSDKDKKDSKKQSFTSPKGEEKVFPIKDQVKSNPNVPMRRKNKICNDGKDWFDTHPDA